MSNLTEKAMLVRLGIKSWTGRKFDRKVTREIIDQHGASPEAGRWNKSLVAKSALFTVKQCARSARAHHYTNTLAWDDWGQRILPAANYLDYMDAQRQFKDDFDAAADEFARNYPQYIAAANAALNGMFNPDDYPAIPDIRNRFSLESVVTPMPDAGDFRVSLNASEVQRIQADLEVRTHNILHDATDECWQRLHNAVSHMAERLSDVDNKFHDTLVTNLRDLVDLLPKLNIAGDPELERMRQAVESKLCRTDPNTLRPSSKTYSKTTRDQQTESADSILTAMAGYVS